MPDQRGYNLTDKTAPYDMATLVGDIVNLISALSGGPIHVAGHDWGGVVAWRLAERWPNLVRSLTILNVAHPAMGIRAVLRGNVRQMLRSSYVLFFQVPLLAEWLLSAGNYHLLRTVMRRSSRPGTFHAIDLQRYTQASSRRGALRAMLGWYRAFWRDVLRLRRLPDPMPIKTPSQIIWGERDRALGVELAEQSARLLPGERLIRLPAATHWVHHEFPREVRDLILRRVQTAEH
jgi:epoxide hydrolase 4